MDLFAKDNPWRPLVLSWVAFFLVGYVLFFMSLVVPDPDWREAFIDYFMPMIKRLNTAKKVALINENNPFPAQLMIIYSAYGTIFMYAISVFYIVFTKEIKSNYLKNATENGISRPKILFVGCFLIFIVIFLYPRTLFILDPKIISRHDVFYYSSSFISATLLLVSNALFSISISAGICAIYSFSLMKKSEVLT